MKRNIKRILALVLCLLTVVQLSVPYASAVYFKDYTLTVNSKKNILGTNREACADTKKSFIYEYNDQYFIINAITETAKNLYGMSWVENVTKSLTVTKYNSEFNKLDEKAIDIELPIWGGFYSGKTYNYIVFGQVNNEESLTKEIFRIVKYDKSFKRISSASVTGGQCDAVIPFDAGTVSIAESPDESKLLVRTSIEHFTFPDGFRHQSQFTISLDTKTMTPSFPNLHVSHSFNQFVQFNGELDVRVDHGDGYPRSVVLASKNPNNSYTLVNLFDIPGEIGANCTGVSVGGFEISANNFIVSINTVDHSKVTYYGNYSLTGLDKDERDAVLLISAKDNEKDENVKKVYLTDYVDKDLHATAPYLIKINDNKFVAMWKEYKLVVEKYDGGKYLSYQENGVKYVVVDENGNKLGNIQTLDSPCNLSDCQPIYHDGKIIWYYDNVDLFKDPDIAERHICVLAIDDAGKHEHPLNYCYAVDPDCTKEGNIEYYHCTVCDKYFKDSSGAKSITQKQTTLEKLPHTPGDWEIVTQATETVTGKKVKKCTVCKEQLDEEIIPKKEPPKHEHPLTYYAATSATCNKNGNTAYYFCSSCKKYFKDANGQVPTTAEAVTLAKLSHKPGSWEVVTEATTTSTGKKVKKCTKCNTVVEEEVIPKKEPPKHEHPLYYHLAMSATCSRNGNTAYYFCYTCEKYFKDVYGQEPTTAEAVTLAKLPHTPGDWQIVTEATTTSTGKKIKCCTVCYEVIDEAVIPALVSLGDVNLDGKINSTDALLALQHSVKKVTLTGQKLTNADVNKDNKVNTTDALKILQYSVGKINKF